MGWYRDGTTEYSTSSSQLLFMQNGKEATSQESQEGTRGEVESPGGRRSRSETSGMRHEQPGVGVRERSLDD